MYLSVGNTVFLDNVNEYKILCIKKNSWMQINKKRYLTKRCAWFLLNHAQKAFKSNKQIHRSNYNCIYK